MTTGEPHAEVTMEISEVNKDPVGSIPTVVTRPFIGKVVKARLNYEGQADVVLFQALSEKGIIATANQGVQANIQCSNSLGGRYCREGVDILDHTFSVTITAIDVGELTCTGVPTGKDDRYFEFGYVESQGLRLMVQGWRNAANGDESKVQLMRQAPARWVGRTVTLVAGCPKTVEICRSRFNNEENIRPFGYGIPSYDPQFEGNPTDG
jgi:hypothetical protein